MKLGVGRWPKPTVVTDGSGSGVGLLVPLPSGLRPGNPTQDLAAFFAFIETLVNALDVRS